MVRFKHRYLLCELLFEGSPTLDTVQLGPVASSTSKESSSSLNQTSLSSSASAPSTVTESALIHLLRDSLRVNFGDIAAGEVGGTFSIKYLSPTTNTLILRVSREHFQTLWASLTLLRKIGGKEVVTKVSHVSGTIRKIQHSAIRLDREEILRSHRRQLERQGASVVKGKGKGAGRETKKEGNEEEAVEARLKESEEKIMALEA
ncbi:RNA-binding protein POP5 [Sporobolomyces salmoneus]|uniref:RNA-binding protein POP5 n=1 Tax=Sporobolomyces salmoneus TaxID=183962 RepID=UPI003179EC31